MEQSSAVRRMLLLRRQSKLHLPPSFQRGCRRHPRRVPWLQNQPRPKVRPLQALRCWSQRLPKVRQYTCQASVSKDKESRQIMGFSLPRPQSFLQPTFPQLCKLPVVPLPLGAMPVVKSTTFQHRLQQPPSWLNCGFPKTSRSSATSQQKFLRKLARACCGEE